MIIYLFNGTEYTTINLPITVSGMYSLSVRDRLIANIISTNNKWKIQLSNDMTSDDFANNNFDIIPYKICNIQSSYNEEPFTFIATPKYDNGVFTYDVANAVTIGNVDGCDITYKIPSTATNNQEVLKLTVANPGLIVETNSNRFFASGQRLQTGMRIKSGDYIFFFGLKVIFVGNRLIVNNPNGEVKIINTNLKLREAEPEYNAVIDPNKAQDDAPLFKKEDYFFKSPRFNFSVEEKAVEIESPPESEPENDTPILLTIGPQLTMVSTSVLSLITYIGAFLHGEATPMRFATSMITIVVAIAGSLLWPGITRKYNEKRTKAKEAKRQEKYKKYLTQKKQEIDGIKINQKETIISNHPSIETCVNIIENKSKELWQRNINHDDFLSVRLGLGTVPSKIKIQEPKESFSIEEEDELFVVLKTLVKESLTISDVPISYTFTKQNINAIVGNNNLIKKVMDSIFLQLLTFHSYTDLKIIVFTKEPNKWDYLKVAPHCWDNQKTIRYFATSVEELSVISADLEKMFDARVANDEEVKKDDDGSENKQQVDYKEFKPYYLFFIDDMTSVRNVALINKILRYKKNIGFSIISTSQSISTLPSETSDFIVVSDTDSAIMTNEINHNNQQIFKIDAIPDNLNMYRCTQKLANIPILVEKAKYELPASISFLELYGLGRVEQLNSLARWSDNNPFLSLAVPIGIDQSGEVFKMDIHEKAYGPHGLVAGTTGSGKSEWIVTYILSLAVNFNPDEVQFVLIDYKGGGLAKSFENEEEGIKLPHLAGTVTNLDKSEIFRSIAAIESELKRRQSMFNDAREKLKEGSMNIYKYQQYYRKGLIEKPLSHLLIICDEFAELKQQQPEFMDQLISTSRIGRSLGVHLILATQKPSGVVNDQIWSNSKFKVCLKVQDKGDSNEILKKPDAAFLKQTGSFYLQVGNDDYYNLGQVAWAGAKYYPSDKIKHKIDESIQYIDNIGRTVGIYEEQQEENRVSQGEELFNIVSYISEISKQITIKGIPLWLENVPTKIILSDILKKYNRPQVQRYNYLTAIGEYDEPRKQEQGLLNVNLADGNIAIIGQGESGIETLVSTIMWSSICDHTPSELAYYVIDYGSETLKKFAKFPQVGEVVLQDDPDKITGVLELITEEIDRRKEILSDYNGSFEYYNKVNEQKMHLIVMVLNSYDIFSESFPKLDDMFTTLFRDAPKCGVIFIVSVNSPSGLRQRQLQYFNHTIVMQMADDSQYRNITNCRRGLIPKKVPGRGICKLDASDHESYCEFQTAIIAEEEKELEVIKAYADKCMNYYKTKVKQLAKIPDDVTSNDLLKYITTLAEVPIGVNFYEKDIAKYDLLSHKINLITSKNIKYDLPFIYGLTSILSKVPNVKVRLIDMLNIFEKPILDIKIFKEDLDSVIAAIENDVLNRTDAQDYGVNIILGAGQFKRLLSKAGFDILKNMFNNVPNSKKCIFILIDDYDKLRTLKLEKWFEQVDVSSGLWLDQGFGNQSLFTIKEVSNEDKKYDFEGLAVNITNEEYKVIKTVMDGDE